MSGGGGRLFSLLSSIPLRFCFFKFPVSPDLFPSGFIHDLHLEIIYVHENKPSAILGKGCVCVHMCVCRERDIRASSVGLRLHQCNSVRAARTDVYD